MRKITNSKIRKENKFEINTRNIFLSLSDPEDRKWEGYNRQFLINVVQKGLERILIKRNIISVQYDGTNGKYLENYRIIRYRKDLKHSEIKSNFPFPDYFLTPVKGSEYLNIVHYDESCLIEKDDFLFDLFFAIQYSLTDIIQGNKIEADEFLKFHLTNTFESNLIKFKFFINRICLKYKEFLKDKFEPLAKQFIENLENPTPENEMITQQADMENKIKINWNGHKNALTDLFRQLKNNVNQENKPLISNSYNEIAYFLKNNFSEFENQDPLDIQTLLSRNTKPKKANKKIVLYV